MRAPSCILSCIPSRIPSIFPAHAPRTTRLSRRPVLLFDRAHGAGHRYQCREPRRQRIDDRNGVRGQVAFPGIIVTDLATIYRAEAYRRDELLFDVGVMDFNKYGGDLIYRVTRPRDQKLIAMAKTGFVFYDYKAGRVCPMPDDFRARFERVNRVD
jgi:acyl-CoA thioesterase FadM